MLCPKCGKESNNIRVCAFCQTPYPTDASGQAGTSRSKAAAAASRASKATPSRGLVGALRNAIARWPRAMRWGAAGLLAALTLAYFVGGRDSAIPVGVVMPNLIAAPMSRTEATNIINEINPTAQLDVRNGELFVRIAAALFPERPEGQLALAQQYARADEIVEGKKRAISFLDPTGSLFARADRSKGVVMTR